MSRFTVFVPEKLHESAINRIRTVATIVDDERTGATEAQYAIVRNFPVDKSLVDRMPNLKAVFKHGAGLETIDTHLLAQRGIRWYSTPGMNANGVAELAITQALRLLRNSSADSGDLLSRELFGRRVAVFGLGNIGRRVAEIATNGFHATVQAYDPYAGSVPDEVRIQETLEETATSAEVLFITCPLNAETSGLVGNGVLEVLADRAVVINTSRAPIVQNDAIAVALNEGRVAGYAHDFYGEPGSLDGEPHSGKVLATPHLGGATEESLKRAGAEVSRLLEEEIRKCVA